METNTASKPERYSHIGRYCRYNGWMVVACANYQEIPKNVVCKDLGSSIFPTEAPVVATDATLMSDVRCGH